LCPIQRLVLTNGSWLGEERKEAHLRAVQRGQANLLQVSRGSQALQCSTPRAQSPLICMCTCVYVWRRRYGDEQDIVTTFGLIQAVISIVQDAGDQLQCIQSGGA
jgi:hypothetical protein